MTPRRRPTTALAILASSLLLGSCARRVPSSGGAVATPAGEPCCLALGLRIAERHRVAAIDQRRFTHAQLWDAMAPSLASPAFRTEVIGRSMQGREIRSVTFGRGPTTVLLWSQMHGDESTATMALADIFAFLADGTPDPLRDRLSSGLTLTFIPMLNPDGAEIFERENAVGVDINRDARALATPEARTLKAVRDRIRPDFGFNLHDQNARTRVGRTGEQAAIALLAPAASADRAYGEVRSRARLVAATIAGILDDEIPGRVAKYDDGFNARAFGDLMQQWGTSTVLIESGALPDDPQKQRLRAINVAAILSALDAIATGRYASADPQVYEGLPFNTGGASDVLVRGGELVLPGMAPVRVDLTLNYDDAVARTGPRLRDVGDLRDAVAIDTIDAAGLFVHPTRGSLTASAHGLWLRIGEPVQLELRRSADASTDVVRRVGGAADR
jgi:hypothetical protein